MVIQNVLGAASAIPTQVCFYAHGAAGTTKAAGRLALPSTLQNIGNAYDAQALAFTAPFSGLYYFSFLLFVVQMGQANDARVSMYWKSGAGESLVAHVHAGND